MHLYIYIYGAADELKRAEMQEIEMLCTESKTHDNILFFMCMRMGIFRADPFRHSALTRLIRLQRLTHLTHSAIDGSITTTTRPSNCSSTRALRATSSWPTRQRHHAPPAPSRARSCVSRPRAFSALRGCPSAAAWWPQPPPANIKPI